MPHTEKIKSVISSLAAGWIIRCVLFIAAGALGYQVVLSEETEGQLAEIVTASLLLGGTTLWSRYAYKVDKANKEELVNTTLELIKEQALGINTDQVIEVVKSKVKDGTILDALDRFKNEKT